MPCVAFVNTNRMPASAAASRLTLRWYLLISMPAVPGGGGASATSDDTGTSAPATYAVRAERPPTGPAAPCSSTMGVAAGVGVGTGVRTGVGRGVGLGVGGGTQP